ncbi:hypothetical protein [Myxococcus hansupus]|nr:hypothetical protein [Myxococcus hansupus]
MQHRKHMAPAALLALTLLGGCKGCNPDGAASGSGEGKDRASSLRSGVKVPLPDGWSAQVAPDESFQAGPPGRPVLRVDLKRGDGEQMPSADTLADRVRDELKDFELSFDQEESSDRYALVRITLAPRLEDGGVGQEAPGFFGARRVDGDLFLCASLPGASPEEVRLATEACRAISVQGSLP